MSDFEKWFGLEYGSDYTLSERNAAEAAWRAARSEPSALALVPVEPTEAMVKEGAHWFEACLHSYAGYEHHARTVYVSMLKAREL
jgi:hypothetical protein